MKAEKGILHTKLKPRDYDKEDVASTVNMPGQKNVWEVTLYNGDKHILYHSLPIMVISDLGMFRLKHVFHNQFTRTIAGNYLPKFVLPRVEAGQNVLIDVSEFPEHYIEYFYGMELLPDGQLKEESPAFLQE